MRVCLGASVSAGVGGGLGSPSCTLEVPLGTSCYTCWTMNIVEQGQVGANTCQELLLLISWYLFGLC